MAPFLKSDRILLISSRISRGI